MIACQIWGKHGHFALQCFKLKAKLMSQPTTHHTMVNNSNPHWFVDFVASHHVISDLNNLSLCQGSEGTESTDDIFSGDGSALPINHLVLHAFPKTSLTFSFYLIFHVCLLYNKI